MKTNRFKKKGRQIKNMGLWGSVVGIGIGLLIYFAVFFVTFHMQYPDLPLNMTNYFNNAVLNLSIFNQTAIITLVFSLIVGMFIGYLLIPI